MNVDVVYGANQSTFLELYTLSKSFIHVLNAVNKKLKPNKGKSPHPQSVSTFEYTFFFTYSTAITNNTTTLSSNFAEFPAQITKNNTAELQRKQHKACFGS